MQAWDIQSGGYRAALTVSDDGHMTLGVTCEAVRTGPLGHFVRLDFAQAVSLCRFLMDRVPGVAEAIGLEGTEA